MFDIHLAWSPIQLVLVLATQLIVSWWLLRNSKSKTGTIMGCLVAMLFTLFIAFDVGTPQQNLNRSKFNAIISNEETVKQESGRITVDDVKKTFEQSVKQTEGNRK